MASFGGFGKAPAAGQPIIEANTPWMAASEGNLTLLQSSLAHLNLPVTAADENGYTLLHAAAAYNQINVMEWLLKQDGIHVNAKDNDGDTPLHHVEKEQAAKVLIELANADPNQVNNEGKTPLASKQEDLADMMDDDEQDDDDDDVIALKQLIDYLKTKTTTPSR